MLQISGVRINHLGFRAKKFVVLLDLLVNGDRRFCGGYLLDRSDRLCDLLDCLSSDSDRVTDFLHLLDLLGLLQSLLGCLLRALRLLKNFLRALLKTPQLLIVLRFFIVFNLVLKIFFQLTLLVHFVLHQIHRLLTEEVL